MSISTKTHRLAAVVVFAAFLRFAAVTQAQRPAGMRHGLVQPLVLPARAAYVS